MKPNLKSIVISAGALIVLALFAVVVWPTLNRQAATKQTASPIAGETTSTSPAGPGSSCATTKRTVEIQGTSLSGILESGDKVTAEMNYYACSDVTAGDIVVYNFPGNPLPLIKIVKGVPGDKLALARSGGGPNILIDGAVLKTSKGEAYAIPSPDMLNLYVRDYKGVIPVDTYLLLGNLAGGSEDSTVFGLVGRSGLLGKVLRQPG